MNLIKKSAALNVTAAILTIHSVVLLPSYAQAGTSSAGGAPITVNLTAAQQATMATNLAGWGSFNPFAPIVPPATPPATSKTSSVAPSVTFTITPAAAAAAAKVASPAFQSSLAASVNATMANFNPTKYAEANPDSKQMVLINLLNSGQYTQAFTYAKSNGFDLLEDLETAAGLQSLMTPNNSLNPFPLPVTLNPFSKSQMEAYYAAAAAALKDGTLPSSPTQGSCMEGTVDAGCAIQDTQTQSNYIWVTPTAAEADVNAAHSTLPNLLGFSAMGQPPPKDGPGLEIAMGIILGVMTAGVGAVVGDAIAAGVGVASSAVTTAVGTAIVGGVVNGTVSAATGGSFVSGLESGLISGALGGAVALSGVTSDISSGLVNSGVNSTVASDAAGFLVNTATGTTLNGGNFGAAALGAAEGTAENTGLSALGSNPQQDSNDMGLQASNAATAAYAASNVPGLDLPPGTIANSEASTTFAIASSGLQAGGVSFDGTSDVTGQDTELSPIQNSNVTGTSVGISIPIGAAASGELGHDVSSLIGITASSGDAAAAAASDVIDFRSVPISTPEEALADIQSLGKTVVSFGGYSGAGYENTPEVQSYINSILDKYDPTTTAVLSGGTRDGIGGLAYDAANARGMTTIGVVSSQVDQYGGTTYGVDNMYKITDPQWGGFIPGTTDLSPTSSVWTQASDAMYNIGGGPVARDEMLGAQQMGIDSYFYPADMNNDAAIAKAVKGGLPVPTDFSGAASQALAGGPLDATVTATDLASAINGLSTNVAATPELDSAMLRAFEAGPGYWSPTGVDADGLLYQRGVSGGIYGGNTGANDALQTIGGTPIEAGGTRYVSILQPGQTVEGLTTDTTALYSNPLGIRGMAPDLSSDVAIDADTARMFTAGQTVAGTITDVGLFAPASADMTWAKNYISLANAYSDAGMTLPADSRGAAFLDDLQGALGTAQWGPPNPDMGNARALLNSSEVDSAVQDVVSKYNAAGYVGDLPGLPAAPVSVADGAVTELAGELSVGGRLVSLGAGASDLLGGPVGIALIANGALDPTELALGNLAAKNIQGDVSTLSSGSLLDKLEASGALYTDGQVALWSNGLHEVNALPGQILQGVASVVDSQTQVTLPGDVAATQQVIGTEYGGQKIGTVDTTMANYNGYVVAPDGAWLSPQEAAQMYPPHQVLDTITVTAPAPSYGQVISQTLQDTGTSISNWFSNTTNTALNYFTPTQRPIMRDIAGGGRQR